MPGFFMISVLLLRTNDDVGDMRRRKNVLFFLLASFYQGRALLQ